MKKTNRLYDLLNRVETDYALYIGKMSLEKLSSLISSYILVHYELTGEQLNFWGEFQCFTEQYYEKMYEIKNHCWRIKGWCDIIEFFSSSDEDAFVTFYQLYAEFKAANGIE